MSAFNSITFIAILPELLLLTLGLLVLIFDPFWKNENRRVALGWLTAGGLFAVLFVSILVGRPGDPTAVLGGMIRFDWPRGGVG